MIYNFKLVEDIVQISFLYSSESVEAIKRFSIRTWDSEQRCWEIPLKIINEIPQVLGVEIPQILKEAYEYRYVQKPIIFNSNFLRPEIKPYPFQISGVEFLASHKNALLSDELGLGKSLQAMVTALHLNCNKVLIICPASLKRQWKREIEKFTTKECTIIGGTLKQRKELYLKDTTFFVVNYELTLKDLPMINLRTWDMVIADEISRIKNYKSLAKKSLLQIKSNFRIGISSYPIENRIQDLHSILSWINPNILGSYWNFINEYCYFCTNPYGGYTITGIKDAKKLHEILKSVMIRRKKVEVFTELPEMIHNNYYIPLTITQQKMYKEIESNIMNLVQREIYDENCLNQIMYLRELCNSPRLLNEKIAEGSKIPEIINIIDQIIND